MPPILISVAVTPGGSLAQQGEVIATKSAQASRMPQTIVRSSIVCATDRVACSLAESEHMLAPRVIKWWGVTREVGLDVKQPRQAANLSILTTSAGSRIG